jgi:hypothetical protein
MLFAYLKYRQGTDAACWPSKTTMANDLGVSKPTIERRLKALIETGYVKRKVRPGMTNLYVLHADPGGCADAWQEKEEQRRRDKLVQDDNPPADIPPRKNDHPPAKMGEGGGSKMGEGGGSKMPPHDDIHERESKDDNNTMNGSDARANFSALAKVCKIDLATITPTQRGKLNQVEKLLRTRKGVTAEDISAFGDWWYGDWWQGRNGQPPRPMQIRENWGAFEQRDNAQRSDKRMRVEI